MKFLLAFYKEAPDKPEETRTVHTRADLLKMRDIEAMLNPGKEVAIVHQGSQ